MKKIRVNLINIFLSLLCLCAIGCVFSACSTGSDQPKDQGEQEDLTYVKYAVTFWLDTVKYDSQNIYYQQKATMPKDPVKEGYIFVGWKTKEGETFDPSVPIVKSWRYYAQWEKKIVQVYTAEDLMELQEDDLADYVLMNDIDFGGHLWDGKSIRFEGSFEGNGHSISNIKLQSSFIYLLEGSIKNLSIEYAIDVLDDDVGTLAGLVGYTETFSSILNCSASGSIIVKPGGDTYNYGEITIGGLVGAHGGGRINNCSTKVKINVETDSMKRPIVGGLVGINEAGIVNSYSVGSIRAVATNTSGNYVETWAGGFIGWEQASSRNGYLIEQCYADVDVVAIGGKECDAGGFIGRGSVGGGSREGCYVNCFALGDVSCDTEHYSGLKGVDAFAGSIYTFSQRKNCYTSSAAVIKRGEKIEPSNGIDESVLCSETFLTTTLQFDPYIWKFDQGKPYLYWQNSPLYKNDK